MPNVWKLLEEIQRLFFVETTRLKPHSCRSQLAASASALRPTSQVTALLLPLSQPVSSTSERLPTICDHLFFPSRCCRLQTKSALNKLLPSVGSCGRGEGTTAPRNPLAPSPRHARIISAISRGKSPLFAQVSALFACTARRESQGLQSHAAVDITQPARTLGRLI